MDRLEQTKQAWEEYAAAYDREITPSMMRVADEALRLAGVGPDHRLLDIACGGGAAAIPAARLGASVLAIDRSRAMTELVSQKAAQLNLTNIEVRLMDGTALELDDDSFDFACSQLGIMLFPDRGKGLSEMVRVVRPHGKGVLVAFGPPERVKVISLFFAAMVKIVPGFTPPLNSPLFCLQDQDVMRQEMKQAGFRTVDVSSIETVFEVETGDQLWDKIIAAAPAVAGLIKGTPESLQQAIRSELNRMLRALSDGSGPIGLPMSFNVGIGSKGPN